MFRIAWPLIPILLAAVAPVDGQEAPGVRGVVVDSAGRPLPGVAVFALPSGARIRTDSFGRFQLALRGPERSLVAAHPGFRPDTVAIVAHAESVVIRLLETALSIGPITVPGERSRATASAKALRALDLHLRPAQSSQELLRLTPGLVIAQHSGGGKAEQIFLRGFDADHGTDVAVSVDGVPVNVVSHAHGQGYADLHFLIPELVERVEVRKGPFDARDGDFATAGAVQFRTRSHLPEARLSVRAGSFGTANLFAAAPVEAGSGGGGYVAVSALRSDGPFEAEQDHRRLNLFAKWTAPMPRGEWFGQLSGFGAGWNASGQIPLRVVRAGTIGRFGAIDPTEGGSTHRADATLGLRSGSSGEGEWEAQAFATRYGFRLFSNFTFFLNNPEEGDGIEQVDQRWIYGGRASYLRANRPGGLPGLWRSGVEARSDRADVALHHQRERRRLRPRVEDRVEQDHLAAWAQQELRLHPAIHASLGLRADLFRFGVLDRLPGPEGTLPLPSETVWEAIASPRLNLSVDVAEAATVFASAGTGFHSNDARDVVQASRGQEVLPRAVSGELGVRAVREWASLSAALWALGLESELVYVGDEGVTEASGRTRRAGIDLEGRLRLLSGLWADADLNLSRGRFPDEPSGADFIPLAPNLTSTGGLTLHDVGPLTGRLRYRHIGSRPADETGSVRATGATIWEISASRTAERWEVTLTLDNLFDAAWNEAQFATSSRLRHEAQPVTELHFTPGAPRSLQVGLTYRF